MVDTIRVYHLYNIDLDWAQRKNGVNRVIHVYQRLMYNRAKGRSRSRLKDEVDEDLERPNIRNWEA